MFRTPQKNRDQRTLSHSSSQHGASSQFINLSAKYDQIRQDNSANTSYQSRNHSPVASKKATIIKIDPKRKEVQTATHQHNNALTPTRFGAAGQTSKHADQVCEGCFNKRLMDMKKLESIKQRGLDSALQAKRNQIADQQLREKEQQELQRKQADKKYHLNYYTLINEERQKLTEKKQMEKKQAEQKLREDQQAYERQLEKQKRVKKQTSDQHSQALLQQIQSKKALLDEERYRSKSEMNEGSPQYWQFIENQQEERNRRVESQKKEVQKSFESYQQLKSRKLIEDRQKQQKEQKMMDQTLKKQHKYESETKKMKSLVQSRLQQDLKQQINDKKLREEQQRKEFNKDQKQMNDHMNYQEWVKRKLDREAKDKQKDNFYNGLKSQIESKEQLSQKLKQKDLEKDRQNQEYLINKNPRVPTEPCLDCKRTFPKEKFMFNKKFQFYKPLPFHKGYGFELPDGTEYLFDDYGGWTDDGIWYDPEGIPRGTVDGHFKPNWISGQGEYYKSGPKTSKFITTTLSLIDQTPSEIKFEVRFFGFPSNMDHIEIIKYLLFKVGLKNGDIFKSRTQNSRDQQPVCELIVQNKEAAKKCMQLHGRNYIEAIKQEKRYRTHEISLIIKEDSYQKRQKQIQDYRSYEGPQSQEVPHIVHFSHRPLSVSDEDFIIQLCNEANISGHQILNLTMSQNFNHSGVIFVSSDKVGEMIEKTKLTIDGKTILFRR